MTVELPAVAVMALALLHEQPAHPYEVFRTLEQRCDTRLVRVNAGAVYHAVERLVADGLAEAVGTEREGRRPERTTYRVTEAGRAALGPRIVSLLADDHPAYPLFPVGLAEAPHVPREDVLAALGARRDRLADAFTGTTARLERAARNGLPLRYVLDADHEAAMIAAEIAWLDDVIARISADPAPWDVSDFSLAAAPVGAPAHPVS